METNKRILVIDDNEFLLSALKNLLEYNGFQVETCSHAVPALALAEEHPFDIYVIDYRLPGINGDAITVVIRRMQPTAIIIGSSAESKEQAFLRAGADTFIAKQELPVELLAFMRQTLGAHC